MLHYSGTRPNLADLDHARFPVARATPPGAADGRVAELRNQALLGNVGNVGNVWNVGSVGRVLG